MAVADIGTVVGFCLIFFILVIVSVLRLNKGKSYKGFYIASVVLFVLTILGSFAQQSAGQAQTDADIACNVCAALIEVVGAVVLVVKKKKLNSDNQQ